MSDKEEYFRKIEKTTINMTTNKFAGSGIYM